MARVKRGRTHIQKRKRLLAKTKGFKAGRKNKIKLAKPAARKAGVYAYRDRRRKKRQKRSLWQININAFVRKYELSYSRFIHLLKIKNIEIDRKMLYDLALKNQKSFEALIQEIKK